MRKTPGSSNSLAIWTAVLDSTQVHGVDESGDSGATIGGDYSEDIWVDSSSVAPLSRVFLPGLTPRWKNLWVQSCWGG